MSDYTTMLANSTPDDVKAALGALSVESRSKLVEAINGIKEPSKTLAEYATDVGAANLADLNTTIAGLAPDNREKIEGALGGVEPIEEKTTQEAKNAPVEFFQHEPKEEREKLEGALVGIAQQETKEEREFEDPVVVETATTKVTGRFCC